MRNYWEKFYKKKHTMKPSPFAKTIPSHIGKMYFTSVIDVLAGNGRDIKYFREQGLYADGVDKAMENEYVKKMSLNELLKTKCKYELVYSRFGLHCLNAVEVEKLIAWSKKAVAFEWRGPGDKPELYPNKQGHTRKNHKPELIIKYLLKYGFSKISLVQGRGLAKYKGEDPLICRIYAIK